MWVEFKGRDGLPFAVDSTKVISILVLPSVEPGTETVLLGLGNDAPTTQIFGSTYDEVLKCLDITIGGE